MDLFFTIAALGVLSIPVGLVAAAFAVRGPDWIAAGFLPYRSDDGWPRGVQEEDPSFAPTFRLRPGAAAAEAVVGQPAAVVGAMTQPELLDAVDLDGASSAASGWLEPVPHARIRGTR